MLSAVLVGALGACGGSDDTLPTLDERIEAEPDKFPTPGPVSLPGSVQSYDAMKEIRALLGQIEDRAGTEEAVEANKALVPLWESIRARVQFEDPSAPPKFESGFAALTQAVEQKDAAQTRSSADELIALADDYLSRDPIKRTPFPSSSSTATSTPSASASVGLGSFDMRGTTISTATP